MLADAVLMWTVAGVVLAAILAGLTVWLVAQGHASRVANAHEAEVALAGITWKFRFELRPTAGPGRSAQPPVEIRTDGANVWVHAVRLSWKPSRPGEDWSTDDAECSPWRPEESLPMQLFSTGRALKLAWPGPSPARQEQLHTRLRIQWSATEGGPMHWREADSGNTNWQ